MKLNRTANTPKIATSIITIVMLTIIVFSLLYLFPQKIEYESVAVSDFDSNDTITVSISITKQRHFFRPNQITGQIVFDGTEYKSLSTMGYDIYDQNDFFENLKLKFQNFSYDLFVRADLKGQQKEMLKDTITISDFSASIISIYKFDDSRNGGVFYTIDLTSQ